MAHGRGRGLAALLISALVLTGACSSAEVVAGDIPPGSATTITPTTAPAATGTTSATTTTVTAVTTTITTVTTTGSDGATAESAWDDFGADIGVPEGTGPFPAVVLVHGGGWVTGDPGVMADLATHLTDNGFLTVNTPYQLAQDGPSFPDAVDDVACAVRLAGSHPRSDGSVAVLGHSAGAHLAALVALSGDRYGDECPYPRTGLPGRLIGLAGPYDVKRLGLMMMPFFGAGPNAEPEAWHAGNPLELVEENTTLSSLLMYGELDTLVDATFAIDFHDALIDAGSEATLEAVEGARHMDMRDPALVGDLIVVWLERAG